MTRFSLILLGVMLVMMTVFLSQSQAELMRSRRGHLSVRNAVHHAKRAPSVIHRRETEKGKKHKQKETDGDHEQKNGGNSDDAKKAYSSRIDDSDTAKDAQGSTIAKPGSLSSPIVGEDYSATPVPYSSYEPEAYRLAPSARSVSAECTFTSYAQLSTSKLSQCKSVLLSSMAVPAGKTLDLSGLSPGTTVTFAGETTFGHANWEGPLILVSGSNLHITGAPGSVLNGGGARWWDGLGDNGTKKPKFFAAHKMVSSVISFITVKDTPVQAFSINGAKMLTIDHVKIDSSAGNVGNKGRNTDAFDVGSSDGVTISNAWVHNQDDCLAINSGTNILFEHGTCIGGHGLSIGSVGGRDNNKIHGVRIVNSHVVDSEHAIRIKTIAGATGSVSNVIYDSITMSGIRQNGIVIEQDYLNGGPTGRPTSGVPITDLTLSNISGQVNPGANSKHILCANGSCEGWKVTGVHIQGGRMGVCSGCPLPEFCSSSQGSVLSNVQARNQNDDANPQAYSNMNHSGKPKADSGSSSMGLKANHDSAYKNSVDDSDSPSDPAFLGGGLSYT